MIETLLVDGHVHLYPQFDLAHAIKHALDIMIIAQRTSSNRDDAIKIWLLTERSDARAFESLKANPNLTGYQVVPTEESESLIIKNTATQEPVLYVLAGRQIVTRENLEIFSLASEIQVADRSLPAAECIQHIRHQGGVPVVNWAPGKWFAARGRVVTKLFEEFHPRELLLGDTTMRPKIWPTPRLMKSAMQKGFKVIAGSDPLPFTGEEEKIGTYNFIIRGEFDYSKPAASIRKLLQDESTPIIHCGWRSGLFEFAKRQIKIMRQKD